MKTRSIRRGQSEIGVIEHQGREFAACGSSVHGRNVIGYTGTDRRGNVLLTRWDGSVMLACRSSIVETYDDWETGDKPVALVFALTHGRYIVGYALNESGSLFRGELLTNSTPDDARSEAIAESEYWARIDADDRERFDAEMAAEFDNDDTEDSDDE